jgi:hypothetical protein
MLLRHGNDSASPTPTHIASEGFQHFSIGHELGHSATPEERPWLKLVLSGVDLDARRLHLSGRALVTLDRDGACLASQA